MDKLQLISQNHSILQREFDRDNGRTWKLEFKTHNCSQVPKFPTEYIQFQSWQLD